MANCIWKFPLEVKDEQQIDMPFGFIPLSVQVQNGLPCLWAIVDPSAARVRKIVHIVGTGHPMPSGFLYNAKYLGTFQLKEGALVYHLFI